jgi:hypothetical protein
MLLMAAGGASASLIAVPARTSRANSQHVFRPESYGAQGEGVGNDTAAFATLAAAVNANGGGIVELRNTTYIVGAQLSSLVTGSQGSFDPQKIFSFADCRQPLVIRGNGARLRCAHGLRYGIFDPKSGQARRTQMPYLGPGWATPYHYMIRVENCSGPILIEDLELDGNVTALVIGGQYGDTGWQIPATGIALVNNRGEEVLRNIHTHHHAQDGLLIDGDDRATRNLPIRRLERVRSEHNGRQGCSIVGGLGYRFHDCAFNHTGRSALSSAPGAGVDIEAEGGKQNRDFRFVNCQFANNTGAGMVADTGDSEGVTFERCTFIGTTNWSAWPNKPRFAFLGCSFVGALTRAFGDADPRRAAQFLDCTFRDDPKLSINGRVYRGTNPDGPLADLSDARNVRFARCAFLATHSATLPWSTGAIYEDCRMEQRVQSVSFPRGRFVGRTTINGKVDLYGSAVQGELLLNGVRRGPDPISS